MRVGGPPLDPDQLAVLQCAIGQAVGWSRAESFRLVIDPHAAAERPRIGFDRVVIGHPEPGLVHVTTLPLA
ncbi:MAG: hypothetical protein AAF196_15540 [Planctomycetota bacterium]